MSVSNKDTQNRYLFVNKIIKPPAGAPDEYEFTCFLALGYAATDAHICKQKEICVKDRIHENVW